MKSQKTEFFFYRGCIKSKMLEIRQSICVVSFAIFISWFLFGIENLKLLLLSCILFLIGVAVCFVRYGLQRRLQLLNEYNILVKNFRTSRGIPTVLRDKDRFKNYEGYVDKHAMTGFDNIDLILEQIIENIMHDFIDSWYKNISSNKLFQESLKRTARRTVAAFSHCVKEVDWTPLLTRHFVDDFASHLRLYRKAKENLQSQKERLLKTEDLESVFFDLELEMEKNYCRDLVATSPLYESAYLHDIVDILLYLMMPSEDFRSRPLRFLIREIIITKVIVPVLDKLSDPLYVNYLIVWLLSSLPIGTDDFVTSLETCRSVQELESILESIHEEINSLRSKDNGLTGDHAESFKQQLASLEFTENLIKRRMVLLANQPEIVIMKQLEMDDDNNCGEMGNNNTTNFVHLPIMVVLTHQTAISFFVDFLTQIGGQNFIDFYLSIEGFKVSVEHQMNGLFTGETIDHEVYETVKEAALFMYRQYLSHEAITRVPLDDSIINKFLARLRNDEPFDSWFEQIQEKLVDILTKDERFYPAFKRHPLYLRMLEDLGILSMHEDDDEEQDEEMYEEDACANDMDMIEKLSVKSVESAGRNFAKEDESRNDSDEFRKSSSALSDSATTSEFKIRNRITTSPGIIGKKRASTLLEEAISASGRSKAHIQVCVETLGLGQQRNTRGRKNDKLFALYNVRVTKTDAGGRSAASWNVVRRYSDFHTLNATVICRFPNLRNLSFPGKKTFNNLDQTFLEKRCKALNAYMSCILQPSLLESNSGLEAEIINFLSQQSYRSLKASVSGSVGIAQSAESGAKLSKKVVSAMFDPILSGVKAFGTAVTAVPDQVFDGIGKVGSELNRAATHVLKTNNSTSLSGSASGGLGSGWRSNSNILLDSNRVAAHLDDDSNNESIPLRVLLLFLDEVFGLRGRNQWFRRRLVALLRQFVNAALGSSINRRILDAVQWLTGADQVAQYLAAFRDSMWGGTTVTEMNPSSEALRTRFLARCLMLSALPDELRLFIGASTTIHGVNNISEALQNRHLNRRFWYVIFERLVSTIFPNNRFEKILPILHSKSPRTRFA